MQKISKGCQKHHVPVLLQLKTKMIAQMKAPSNDSELSYDDGCTPTNPKNKQTYFTVPLPNTVDVAAQINIGEEQVAKLLTAYSQDNGVSHIVTKKKFLVKGKR